MFCVPQNSPATRALESPRVARVEGRVSRCSPPLSGRSLCASAGHSLRKEGRPGVASMLTSGRLRPSISSDPLAS